LSYPAWKWNDLSESDACDRYAIHFLRYLPRNATAFISGDNQVFPAAYEVLALRKRADLELIEFPGALFPPKDADGFQDDKVSYEKKRFETRGHCLFLPNERVVAPPFLCRPFGLMYRLSDSATDPSLASPPPPDWLPLHATEAEKRDPESLEALSEGYLMAAVWASDRGDRTEALDQLGKAVDLGRDSVRTLINASAQASKLDADDFSEKTLKRALEISPGHFEAHLNLGILFGKMGHYDKARRYLWEAETISPGNPTVRYYLAQIQQITGRSR